MPIKAQHISKFYDLGMQLTAKSLGIKSISKRLVRKSASLMLCNQILRENSTRLFGQIAAQRPKGK